MARSDARRTRALERVDRQIGGFLGPLLAELRANDAAWQGFSRAHWPAHGRSSYFTPDAETSDDEAALFRLWVRTVFMPINERIEALILGNAELLNGLDPPRSFSDFLAHVAGYRATMARWDAGDFGQSTSVNNYDAKALLADVEDLYRQALDEQAVLLRHAAIPRMAPPPGPEPEA